MATPEVPTVEDFVKEPKRARRFSQIVSDILNSLMAKGSIVRVNGAYPFELAASGGIGTVSSVSVVTANGISGTVATATTTPAITLTINTLDGGSY